MKDTCEKDVLFEKRQDGIAIITLNRPSSANAFSKNMLHELQSIINEVRNSQDIRVVILTGTGTKAFCAGADLKERKGMNDTEVKDAVRLIGSTITDVETLPQPVIAAINGVAFGGGLEIALACDIRIGTAAAKLGLTETSLAIIPGAGGTQRLPRLIGPGKAKELIYCAKRLTAEEAKEIGILEYIYPSELLMEKAIELAEEMVKNGPLALIQAKLAINKGLDVDLATGLKIEELAYSTLIPSEDRMEGLKAFTEKRLPHYQGK
ncbi:enoyl-CoA hydratase [Bacillus dakarensis]|uniref:enoyl-CoA hydratase n=1 Tax=Robertmurraya dakarensis TaxID=1926278 RepID=UPI000980F58A|nr:enoyl-CoA hydratase [Bacillus dakarensis]